MALTAEMIDVYDDLFGPYPFVAYGAVVVDEPLGVRPRDPDPVDLRHRRGHQRVGHRPRARPPVVRRRRQPGHLAGHLAQRGVRHLRRAAVAGAPGRRWPRRRSPMRTGPARRCSTCRRPTRAPARLFAPSVYDRGALTLLRARQTVGDDTFLAILRDWLERYDDGVGVDRRLRGPGRGRVGARPHPHVRRLAAGARDARPGRLDHLNPTPSTGAVAELAAAGLGPPGL